MFYQNTQPIVSRRYDWLPRDPTGLHVAVSLTHLYEVESRRLYDLLFVVLSHVNSVVFQDVVRKLSRGSLNRCDSLGKSWGYRAGAPLRQPGDDDVNDR
jgi:hypothetical protein